MPEGWTIGAAKQEPDLFACPNCKKAIETSSETCRYCAAKVDYAETLREAAIAARIKQGCSDARYMRNTALTMPIFFFLRFVPFLASVGATGYLVLVVAIPIWALRWRLKFNDIRTDDSDFARAQTRVRWIGSIVTSLLALSLAAQLINAFFSTLKIQ